MADLDQLYTALKNADAAGDTAGAQKLAAYIKAQPTQVAQPAAPAAEPEPSMMDSVKQGAANLGSGLVRGAGSIGATILYPVDKITDMVKGDRDPSLTQLVTGQKKLSRNEERRQAMDSALTELTGSDPNSLLYKTGKLGGEIAGTAGVGSAIAPAAKVLGAAPEVVNAIRTAGMTTGSTGLNLGTRAAGGAINGAASAALVDPKDTVEGGVIGGVLPPALAGAGKIGSAAARLLRGPEQAPELAAAIQKARGSGYVIPPSQANPTLLNRGLEGFAGKLTTAQNASAKNSAVTSALAAKDLGLAADTTLSPAILDEVRAEAGKAYGAAANVGKLNAAGADLPKDVGVKKFTDPLTLGQRSEVDSAEVVRAWKQANHDATGYYRAYGRDANPETLAKAKAASSAASKIDDFLTKSLTDMGQGDVVDALKAARVQIAKTHNIEAAMNPATGTIDAKKLAAQLAKGKYLSGGLKDAADFAGRFPKAAQTPEAMGSLPGTSPLDWGMATGTSVVTGSPLAMLSPLARPAARATALSGLVQNRLVQGAPRQGGVNDQLAQLLYRSAPQLGQ
jgi:hypothetical protein